MSFLELIFVLKLSSIFMTTMASTLYFGRCVNDHRTVDIPRVSVTSCLEECMRRSQCTSVSYQRQFLLCSLNNLVFQSDSDVITMTNECVGYVFVLVRVSTTIVSEHDVTGLCASMPCQPGTRCDETGNGSFLCITTECPYSTPLMHGLVVGNMNTLSAGRLVQCDNGYTLLGTSRFECSSHGQWTEYGRCDLTCPAPGQVPNSTVASAYIMTSLENITTNQDSVVYGQDHYLNGSYVEFTCDAGLAMISANVTSCINGTWTETPVCDVTTTGSPCGSNIQCTIPLTECRHGICQCISGLSFAYDRNTCVDECVTFADTFQFEKEKKLNLLDRDSWYDGFSMEQCREKCLTAYYVCKSFEMTTSACNTATEDANDGGYYRDAAGWTYYQRDCLTS